MFQNRRNLPGYRASPGWRVSSRGIIDYRYSRGLRGYFLSMSDLLPYLTQQLPDALGFLEQMVNMESPSFDKLLVDEFARFVGSKFEAIGGKVDYVRADRF